MRKGWICALCAFDLAIDWLGYSTEHEGKCDECRSHLARGTVRKWLEWGTD